MRASVVLISSSGMKSTHLVRVKGKVRGWVEVEAGVRVEASERTRRGLGLGPGLGKGAGFGGRP